MSKKAIFVAIVVAATGIGGLALLLVAGSGSVVYVSDDVVLMREHGEFLLNKRRHTTDQTQKAELLTEAIGEFKKALALKPDFEVAHNMLGHCYMERGQFDAALQEFNRALELRPEYPVALFNRAQVYQRLSAGKRDQEFLNKAIADYQAALTSEMASNFAGDIHKALAEAYHLKGDIAHAIAELENYLRKAPDAPDADLVARKIRGLSLMRDSGGAAPSAPPTPAR